MFANGIHDPKFFGFQEDCAGWAIRARIVLLPGDVVTDCDTFLLTFTWWWLLQPKPSMQTNYSRMIDQKYLADA
jgi:hypothetical protein